MIWSVFGATRYDRNMAADIEKQAEKRRKKGGKKAAFLSALAHIQGENPPVYLFNKANIFCG